MPLFRARAEAKARPGGRKAKRPGSGRKAEGDGSVLPLARLCLLSLADHMKDVWAKDYADNYLDQFSFRHIMGPFISLPGDLVQELLRLLCSRQQLSRAALHLLLVPQLRSLSLTSCPGLATSALCGHIAARCQGLWSLDVSGAQQLPPKVLSETLSVLPHLRRLSLAGTPCDRCVIGTVARCCRLLRHLDVSRCHLVSPAALLALGGGAFCPSGSDPSPLPPLPLGCLLALDIGFGDHEEDPAAAAAYLLLALPCLERVALEGVARACSLLKHREFSWTKAFADREGVPRLEEVWRQRTHKNREEASAGEDEDEEEERLLWEDNSFDSEEAAGGGNQAAQMKKGGHLSESGHLCPDLVSVSLNIDGHEDTRGAGPASLLAAGLQTWAGQLRNLSVQFPGPLWSLLPAVKVAGSSLVSLTLEGVKTSRHTPLLEVMQACPRLRDLVVSAEPPARQEEEEEDGGRRQDDQDYPRLPDLCLLRLSFSYEHSQMRPVLSWMALRTALKCLLAGSPLLEQLALVALPCPLDSVLQDVLRAADQNLSDASSLPPAPLGRLRHIELPRSDVKMATVKGLVQRSPRLRLVDVRYCWQISQREWLDSSRGSNVQVLWV